MSVDVSKVSAGVSNKFPAINRQQSISSNQFVAINFKQSIFSNKFPAINIKHSRSSK
jgi:hypothetical protein